MALYPLAEQHPVPSFGYPMGVRGQLKANGPRGAFFHDAVGWRHGALAVFEDPNNRASAHIIINLGGPPWQFIDFDHPAWHAGGRIPAGHEGVGALANLFYWGFEYEGGYPTPTPITDYQIDVTIDLCKWLTQVYGFIWPAERRNDLWEHREVANTLCPSDRIRWPEIIQRLASQHSDERTAAIVRTHLAPIQRQVNELRSYLEERQAWEAFAATFGLVPGLPPTPEHAQKWAAFRKRVVDWRDGS